MLAYLLQELDQPILNDPNLDQSLCRNLGTKQGELGLTFGDRPTCPFLRPHIITRTQYDEVARAAQTIALAIERVAERALSDRELLMQLDLTPREAAMARI